MYYCILSTSVTRGLWEKKTRHNTRVGLEPTTSAILEQCCIKVFCFVFWRCNINYTVTLLRLCIPFRDYFPAWKQNLLWIFSDILYKFDYILNWNFQMLILLCICFKNQRKPFSWKKKRGGKIFQLFWPIHRSYMFLKYTVVQYICLKLELTGNRGKILLLIITSFQHFILVSIAIVFFLFFRTFKECINLLSKCSFHYWLQMPRQR